MFIQLFSRAFARITQLLTKERRPDDCQEKCQEQNVDLYMTFVDLTKAFDTVSRDGLFKIMAKFGCPAKFIAMVYCVAVSRWYACNGPK